MPSCPFLSVWVSRSRPAGDRARDLGHRPAGSLYLAAGITTDPPGEQEKPAGNAPPDFTTRSTMSRQFWYSTASDASLRARISLACRIASAVCCRCLAIAVSCTAALYALIRSSVCASKCGMTPQYKQLQELHAKYSEKGLAILGFPANNFGGQEPGTNAEIKEFCTSTYHVGFDMFAKVSVKGDDKCPLYAYLTDKNRNGEFGGDIRWNFQKFLVDRKGRVVARFEPGDEPQGPKVTAAIEKALAEKP